MALIANATLPVATRTLPGHLLLGVGTRDKHFGARLKTVREASGDTQVGLAAAIGVDPSQVSRWELGKQEPRVSQVIALVQRYRHAGRFLLFGEHEGQQESPAFQAFRASAMGKLAEERGWLEMLSTMPFPKEPTEQAYRTIALALLAAENAPGG